MPYVAPGTVAAGDVYTAAAHNIQVANVIDLRSYLNRSAIYSYSGGDITLSVSANFANLPTIGTAGDLTINATAGDVIEAGVACLVGNANTTLIFDISTIVGGTANRSLLLNAASPVLNGSFEGNAYRKDGAIFTTFSGSVPYVTVGSDISSSTVTVRVRYQNGTTADTLRCGSANRFVFFVKNLGPVTT